MRSRVDLDIRSWGLGFKVLIYTYGVEVELTIGPADINIVIILA